MCQSFASMLVVGVRRIVGGSLDIHTSHTVHCSMELLLLFLKGYVYIT